MSTVGEHSLYDFAWNGGYANQIRLIPPCLSISLFRAHPVHSNTAPKRVAKYNSDMRRVDCIDQLGSGFLSTAESHSYDL